MSSVCLKHLEDWEWLRRDYDEVLDGYVVSFPEYSQMFVEMFGRMYSEDSTRERESVLAVYSYLYTYRLDQEKIMKSSGVRCRRPDPSCRCWPICRKA